MAFDISTAKFIDNPTEPHAAKSGFDISTAKFIEPERTVSGFISNIPGSVAGLAKGLVAPVLHPLKTAETFTDIAAGLMEKTGLVKKLFPEAAGLPDAEAQIVDTIGTHLKNQYGTIDGLKKYAYEDPAGFAFDLSTVLMGGGGVVSKIGKAAELGTLVKAGEAVVRAGEVINPVTAGIKVTGAGLNTAGKILQKTGQTSEKLSGRVINSLIKPLLKDFAYGKNPGLEVAKQRIVANDFDDLISKITSKRQDIGQKINEKLTRPTYKNITFDITSDLQPIDNAMEVAAKQNNQALVDRLAESKRAITQNLTIDYTQGQPIIKTLGDKNLINLSPLEATQIKTDIGDLTKWTGNLSDDKLINKALKQTYGKIKERIGNRIPEIKNLNESYANLLSAEVAAKYRDKILSRQDLIKLSPSAVGIGAGVATSIISGKPAESILIGALSTAAAMGMSTPVFKTHLANFLAQGGKIEEFGNYLQQIGKRTQTFPKRTMEKTLGFQTKK